MKLLYRMSEWHALAKLRLHTEDSLTLMEESTKELGKLLRQFRQLTCTEFHTVELPREAEACVRKRNLGVATDIQCPNPIQPQPNVAAPPTVMISGARGHLSQLITSDNQVATGKYTIQCFDSKLINQDVDRDAGSSRGQSGRLKPKILNLLTVKFHFLGDYVQHIRFFGMTDSYSTQLVSNCLVCQIHRSELADTWQGELAHRLIKRFYGLTNKMDPMNQIGKKYNRHEALRPSTDPSEVHETKEAETKSIAASVISDPGLIAGHSDGP
jgi:hypothetical protein